MKYLLYICALLAVSCPRTSAGILVNEALVNEPGPSVTLEWIELYNDSAGAVDLSYYILTSGSSSVNLSGVLDAHAYMVVCRNLYSSGSTPGFEGIWGNNSGVWGDSPLENYRVLQGNFSLTNVAGSARLYRASTVISQLNWPGAGNDGISWERVSTQSDDAAPSEDPTGSTPGRINSASPLPNDLSIDTVIVFPDSGRAHITIKAVNVGLATNLSTEIVLHTYEPTDSTGIGDTLAILPVGSIAPGGVTSIDASIELSGLYALLGATITHDDRASNNQFLFRAPGSDFPPLLLTEFLANPSAPLASEWVEILNVSDSSIDLRSWKLGDQSTLREIIPSSLILTPAQRIVLAQDSTAFRLFYNLFSGLLLQPVQWPTLNNAGDAVRLVDPYGFEADKFVYSAVYPGNVTWGRDESGDTPGAWGEAADTGGTPGTENLLRESPVATGSRISIEPQIFSPDGDGRDEVASIAIQAPVAESYTLRIYDRAGRIVRTFAHQARTINKSYQWNGRSDSGDRLPIGIYICYFEAGGVESAKKTVVIAR